MQTIHLKLPIVVFAAVCAWPMAVSAAPPPVDDRTCGDNPPAYTADRTVFTPGGALKLKFYSAGGLQREDQSESMYRITDLAKSMTYFVNLTAKSVLQKPLIDKMANPGDARKDTYIDRQPKDDGTTLVEAGVNKDGKKNWFARTVCGADGVFLQQELMVPGPDKKMVTIKIVQENIKIGDVPASVFEIPDGLTKK